MRKIFTIRFSTVVPQPSVCLISQLELHRAAQRGERMLASFEWHDEDLALAQSTGRPTGKGTGPGDEPACSGRLRPVRTTARRPAHRRRLRPNVNVHPQLMMELPATAR